MPALDRASRASAATVPLGRGALARSAIGSWVLRIATAAALGIDAVVHWQNASAYDAVTGTVSQGELFRAGAGPGPPARPPRRGRPRPSSWLAAVVLYRYVDVGSLGPLPDMYESTWQVPGKLLSAYAESAAVVLAGLGLHIHRKCPGTQGLLPVAATARKRG